MNLFFFAVIPLPYKTIAKYEGFRAKEKIERVKGQMKIGRQFNYLFTCTIINNQNIYESTIAKPSKQKHKSQTATLVKQYNLTQNGK